jgi:hypothetical protein
MSLTKPFGKQSTNWIHANLESFEMRCGGSTRIAHLVKMTIAIFGLSNANIVMISSNLGFVAKVN